MNYFNKLQMSLLLILVLNIFFALFEFYIHAISNSLIIFSHLLHNVYDIIAIIIAFVGSILGSIKSDNIKSFGYHRYMILAALLNGIFLLSMNFKIMIDSLFALFSSHYIQDKHLIPVSIIGALVKLICFLILHKNENNNLNSQIVLLHIINDLLIELIAIFAIVFVIYSNLEILDSIGALIVSITITLGALKIIKKSSHILCNGSPEHIKSDIVINLLKKHFNFIVSIHHIHIWYSDENNFISSMHIVINQYCCDVSLHEINQCLLDNFNIVHNTIQIEKKCSDNNFTCLHN